MSIADPLPAGGRVPLSPREIKLRAEEFDRRYIAAEKRKAWQKAMAEAAYLKQHGPRPPFPRMADQWEGEEYWANSADIQLAKESAVMAALGEKRESDYVEHCMNTAGFVMDPEPYQKSLRRRFTRFDQSMRLALALVKGGARRPESRKNAPSILTLVSRQEIKLPIIPRVNFLPEAAASRRSPMLKEVETYASRHPLARMATFTAGQRSPIAEIRTRTTALTRKLSRLNSEKWFKPVATIPFRAVEFGTPKLCSQSAQWTFHIHAHTIFKVHRFVHPKRWRKFCRKVSAFMGAHWDGGRPIEDAREMVKYPVKPADLEKLLEVGGIEPICEFYRQTVGMRLVETLGTLRAQRSSVKNTKRKRTKERNAEGEWLPAMRRNWNSHGRSVTKAALRAKREKTAATGRFRAGMEAMQGFCTLPEPDPAAPKMTNRIVARLAPSAFASRVYEPAVFVWNFNGDWNAITSHRCVSRVVEAVRPKVQRALDSLAAAERRAAGGGHNRSHQSHSCPNGEPEFELSKPPPEPFRQHLEAIST